MEHPAGHRQQAARMARFERIYLSHLVVMLRRGRMDQRATSLSARCQAVKLAADISLAMTARGQTAWRLAILRKYLFRLRKSRCQLRLADFRENSQRKRRLVSAKRRPCKPNAPCNNSRMQMPKDESRLTGTKRGRSRDDCDEVAGGIMGSRIQTLRLLVPGSGGLDTPVFLKETANYIVALKMQVQAMQALVECYSNSNANASHRASI